MPLTNLSVSLGINFFTNTHQITLLFRVLWMIDSIMFLGSPKKMKIERKTCLQSDEQEREREGMCRPDSYGRDISL